MTAVDRKPYHGSCRKLVLAFDVGTTYSGISYSILDPGYVPQIKGVNRYPAQESVGGDSKIPSILWYDQQGRARAIGAEALQESILEKADDEDWVKLEWWKLHLRPKNLALSQVNDDDIPMLPQSKSAVEVLGDFMKYLYQCAQSYIQDTHASGQELWRSVEDHIDFVLTHPNGWEGAQQTQIRRAAVLAGLVPDTEDGQSRIQLLTEGESSLHFCIGNGLTTDFMTDEQAVIIVDAGGGTVDLSTYHVTSTPVSCQEIAPAECLLQGSTFVSRRARTFLQGKLCGSRFSHPDYITRMTECFDKTAKLRFRSAEEPSFIKFGIRDKDLDFNIKSGQLKLPGTDVAALFEPSIQGIIDAIERHRQAANEIVSSIFLVGGFSASPWLFSRLQAYLLNCDIKFCRPDNHANKAVADGAISFYLDHRVSSRMAKVTYGMKCSVTFDPSDPQHRARENTTSISLSGNRVIPNAFDTILKRGVQVSQDKEFRRSYLREHRSLITCNKVQVDVICYQGCSPDSQWMDAETKMFSVVCTVTADTSGVTKAMTSKRGANGKRYYCQEYDIILMFGLTELKAQISWMENGQEQRGPATIVYDQTIAER